MEKYFPFDATEINGEPDRVYNAADFASFFSQFIGNGIYPNPASNLQVLSLNSNMVITVKSGSAFINGYGYINTEDMQVSINTANSSYNRKDIIVVCLDLVERKITVKYKPGIASANPQEPELIRNSDVHELKLASISVRSGSQSILQSDVTDTRLNKNVCGIVDNIVKSVDTTEIFNQYMDYWQRKKAENEQAWQQQMQSQEQRFTSQQQTIEDWYQNVLADISTLQTFDFDNISELKGAKKTTVFLSDGNIEESIVLTGNNRKIATRKTEFLSDGKIRVNIKVYKEDGTNVLKESTSVTTFKNNGEIEEAVS